MKYKLRDKVRIKSFDWYNQNKDKDGFVRCGDKVFDDYMSEFCGSVVTIRGEYPCCGYDVQEDMQCRTWTEDMFESLVERNGKIYPYKIGDRVVLKGNNRCATITDLKYNTWGNLSYYIKIDNDRGIEIDYPTDLLLPYDKYFEEKKKFYNKIKEAEREFYQKDPCRNCGPGNGCDDCRGCKDGEISHQMYLEVKKLKDDYNKTFNTDYNKEEAERLASVAREVRKKQLLEEIWNKYTLQEIIEVGVKMGKCDDITKFKINNE
jgi:hypothetical protein